MSDSDSASDGGSGDLSPDALDSPRKTLDTIPDEILAMIGREVAPDGGRKAANLRLASRHFDKVIAPIVMSSITFSSDSAQLDELCVALMDKRVERRAVTSVRYNIPATQTVLPLRVLAKLRNLQRLYIFGSQGTERIHEEMYPLLNSVVTLHLECIDLTDRYDLKELAAAVRDLKVTNCRDADSLFSRLKEGKHRYTSLPSNLRSVAFRPSSSVSGMMLQRAINILLVDVYGNIRVKDLRIHWVTIEPALIQDDLVKKVATAPSKELSPPLSVQFTGLKDLFGGPSAPAARAISATVFVQVLNAFATGVKMRSLSLPVHESFIVAETFKNLMLPDLEELYLVNDANVTQQDMLHVVRQISTCVSYDMLLKRVLKSNFVNYTHLAYFLDIVKVPQLARLRLRGWFDKTGVEALSQLSVGNMPATHPLLFSLLGLLKQEGIDELRLENSEGHADVTSRCMFTRKADEEWQSRLVHT